MKRLSTYYQEKLIQVFDGELRQNDTFDWIEGCFLKSRIGYYSASAVHTIRPIYNKIKSNRAYQILRFEETFEKLEFIQHILNNEILATPENLLFYFLECFPKGEQTTVCSLCKNESLKIHKENIKRMLMSLSINYPSIIHTSFTLDLDTVTIYIPEEQRERERASESFNQPKEIKKSKEEKQKKVETNNLKEELTMTLQQLVYVYVDTIKDGGYWLAVWKEGRSWEAETLTPSEYKAYLDGGLLEEIDIEKHPDTIFINGITN